MRVPSPGHYWGVGSKSESFERSRFRTPRPDRRLSRKSPVQDSLRFAYHPHERRPTLELKCSNFRPPLTPATSSKDHPLAKDRPFAKDHPFSMDHLLLNAPPVFRLSFERVCRKKLSKFLPTNSLERICRKKLSKVSPTNALDQLSRKHSDYGSICLLPPRPVGMDPSSSRRPGAVCFENGEKCRQKFCDSAPFLTPKDNALLPFHPASASGTSCASSRQQHQEPNIKHQHHIVVLCRHAPPRGDACPDQANPACSEAA